jgi:hypothetical protein
LSIFLDLTHHQEGSLSQPRFTFAALVLLGGALAPTALAAQVTEPPGPDSVVYTARGRVVFYHAKHTERAECASCHHESKPEKPLASPRQKCGDCHTDPPGEGMKTTFRFAVHNTEERTGICYDCHKTEAEKGVETPARCADCHVREGGGQRP